MHRGEELIGPKVAAYSEAVQVSDLIRKDLQRSFGMRWALRTCLQLGQIGLWLRHLTQRLRPSKTRSIR